MKNQKVRRNLDDIGDGRIAASVRIENLTDLEAGIRCDALADNSASYDEVFTVPQIVEEMC